VSAGALPEGDREGAGPGRSSLREHVEATALPKAASGRAPSEQAGSGGTLLRQVRGSREAGEFALVWRNKGCGGNLGLRGAELRRGNLTKSGPW